MQNGRVDGVVTYPITVTLTDILECGKCDLYNNGVCPISKFAVRKNQSCVYNLTSDGAKKLAYDAQEMESFLLKRS